MASEDHEIWKSRLEVLREQINNQRTMAEELINGNTLTKYQKNSIAALKELLVYLDSFASNQFEYLYNGFFGADQARRLTPLKKYPPQSVMRATVDQVGYDLWVISNAISQRLVPANTSILQKADFLSRKALQPAFGLDRDNNLEDIRVISYFLKSPSVRVIPYAKAALIGIPYTAGQVFRDFLAIPHEVGHLVYWLGTVSGESVYSILQHGTLTKNSYANRWIEEIFADIYGASVAGPALALSFQDLHMQVPQDEFFEDDWDHPPAILRPNIYAKVLHKKFPNFAKALHKLWNGENIDGKYQGGRIQNRLEKDPTVNTGQEGTQEEVLEQYERKFKLGNGHFVHVKCEMTIEPNIDWEKKEDEKEKKIDNVVKFIFQKIHGSSENEEWMDFSDSWWLNDVPDGDDIHTIFPKFEAKVQDIKDEDIVDEVRNNEQKPTNNVVIQDPQNLPEVLKSQWEGMKQHWIDEGKKVNPDLKEEHAWVYVYLADGWTTEGPESNPPFP